MSHVAVDLPPRQSPNSPCTLPLIPGKIILVRSLDYEDPSIPNHQLSLKVAAYTEGPDVRSATATILVNIQDINDHSPQFDQDVSRDHAGHMTIASQASSTSLILSKWRCLFGK